MSLGSKSPGRLGTAQKYDEKTHLPSHERYTVSFVGFMPADDPAFVALVLVDEAQVAHDKNYGGMVAAPVFSRIAERAARYLGLKASMEEPAGSVVAGQNMRSDFRDQ